MLVSTKQLSGSASGTLIHLFSGEWLEAWHFYGVAQQLVNEFPDIYLQSHVAENRGEIEWVKELFPWSRSYLDVYDHYGLLGDRSVYAHCIYLDEQDRHSLARSGTAVSFCPSSNLFLGSGLFDLSSASELDLHLGLGTDIGAGTSFSLLQCMRDAYKVGQLTGFNPSPLYYFYLATLGAARALYLDDRLGSFETGREADFIVIDRNIFEIPIEELKDTIVDITVLGGKVVFNRESDPLTDDFEEDDDAFMRNY